MPLLLPATGVPKDSFQATRGSCLRMDRRMGEGSFHSLLCFAICRNLPSASFPPSDAEKAEFDRPWGRFKVRLPSILPAYSGVTSENSTEDRNALQSLLRMILKIILMPGHKDIINSL